MNPILLKPTTDVGSQVIVNGHVVGNMRAMEYFRRKRDFIPAIMDAYCALDAAYDVIVIEGAGSPAEINLKQQDIVNMGLAELVTRLCCWWATSTEAACLHSCTGTVALLEEQERRRIKALSSTNFAATAPFWNPDSNAGGAVRRACGGGDSL